MSRFKNYGLWVAIFALIGMLVNDFTQMTPEEYEKYVNAILGILIAAGIITNPSIGVGYSDKKKKKKAT